METTLLKLIEKNIKILKIDFKDELWRDNLPSGPGWYFIETNTPPQKFDKVGKPKGELHYNIPEKAKSSLSLNQVGACILPSKKIHFILFTQVRRRILRPELANMLGVMIRQAVSHL